MLFCNYLTYSALCAPTLLDAGSSLMALLLYAFNVQFGSTMAPEIVPCK